jgi:UDP-3-O-[3-hydroxymyristoyl] glucosamine N-acyltransferase
MELDVKLLLSDLGIDYQFEGTTQANVKRVTSVYEAIGNDLAMCYYEGEKGASIISKSDAGVILCTKNMEGLVHPKSGRQQLFFVVDPKIALVQIIDRIYKKKAMVGISKQAVISENAKIGSDCYIGDYVVIGDNCRIGDKTIIYDRVSLVQNCCIGNGCVIEPGVTIGTDGFGFVRYRTGELERFPHLSGVKIGNNVEVGANTNIERGSLSDTRIGDGTKVDSLVLIGHNVVIGRNCIITGGTIIGGSTKIGDMCWTGLNSTLKDRIKIGNNVLVAVGAVVIQDVEDGDVVAGIPAKSIKEKVTTDKMFLMAGQAQKELNKIAHTAYKQ